MKSSTKDNRRGVWFKGHHYYSQIGSNIRKMLWLDNYKGWKWRYMNLTWFGHADDCCDYWTPIHLPDGTVNPKVKRAFMLDDDLKINLDNEEQSNDL